MTKFKNLSPEEIASQHQMILDMLLHAVSHNSPETKDKIADTLDQITELFEGKGQDTTLIRALRQSISGER